MSSLSVDVVSEYALYQPTGLTVGGYVCSTFVRLFPLKHNKPSSHLALISGGSTDLFGFRTRALMNILVVFKYLCDWKKVNTTIMTFKF